MEFVAHRSGSDLASDLHKVVARGGWRRDKDEDKADVGFGLAAR